jgi:SpoVK/Ycf46/Vps4 family AAA+-type ATPase
MDYFSRVADEYLSFKLETFGGVLITGPKGCGKTTTAKQRAVWLGGEGALPAELLALLEAGAR